MKMSWEELKGVLPDDVRTDAEMALGSAEQYGAAVGLCTALLCSMYANWTIGIQAALLLLASVMWMREATLVYYIKKYL